MSKKRAEGTELEKFMKENLYNNSDSPKVSINLHLPTFHNLNFLMPAATTEEEEG